MNTPFGEVFLFLTDLAWKSRVTIPMLVTTIFLIMDIRLQIEINIQSGQAAADLDQIDFVDDNNDDDDDDVDDDDDDVDSDDYLSDDAHDEDENSNGYMEFVNAVERARNDRNHDNAANRLRRSLGWS
ncbi:uncharacterized protein LOC129235723 [Anastrepha obliqua]|uniref:uncharacterized protein LOC129235723 n=1 Tax=Anastrepha obliqua TaxID=95512 RepID=UPI0024098BB0|nr:uncharacterized protein LOC129235723 [Anastrepha obliqua]